MVIERHSHARYIIPIILLCVIVVASVVVLVNRTNRMFEAESTLAATQSELSEATAEAVATQTELMTTQAELTQTRTGLATTQSELTEVQNELQTTSSKLTSTLKKLTATEADYATTKEQLATEREQIDAIQENLDALQINYDRMTTGYGYVLKDPTYQALKSFLAADSTDANLYDINNYVCVDFSTAVKANAIKQKIRCAYVIIDYPGGTGHAIVAFNTTDKGIIYIEPQHDDEVNLQIGKYYYQCIIPKPGHYYEKPNYDDSVVDIKVIW
jgi:hypothetical protein